MTRVPFQDLPDDARLWVFASNRPMDSEEESRLLAVTDDFLDGWVAHATPLFGARDWRRGRFLLVAVDENRAPPSGCSIDALVHLLKGVEEELDVELVDKAPVWYLDGDEVRSVSRSRFGELARAGEVNLDTPVFDLTLTRLAELREGGLEVPARESWHGKAFFQGVGTS